MRIDNNSYVPKYVQIKDYVIKQIEDCVMLPHQQLMSIHEIAHTCAVSDVTVRKALNELVHDGYIYAINGKGTFVAERKKKIKTLAVVMPHVSMRAEKGFHVNETLFDCAPVQLHYIENEAFLRGWTMQLYIYNYNLEKQVQCLEEIAESKADGAIIYHSSTKNTDALYNLRDSGIPMAFIDEYIDGMGIGYVSTDNYAGAYEVTNKLAEIGYEKIFYVTRGDKIVPIIERDRGYMDAMRDLNMQPDIIATFHHPVAYEEGTRDLYREIAKRMIESTTKPFAVFGVFPSTIHLLHRAFDDLAWDLTGAALACYDDPWVFRDDRITLLKVIQPLEEMSRKCVALVDKGASDCILLKPDIISGWGSEPDTQCIAKGDGALRR